MRSGANRNVLSRPMRTCACGLLVREDRILLAKRAEDRFFHPGVYLGEPSGFAYSDTLEVARQGNEWRVDRLPRNHNPD